MNKWVKESFALASSMGYLDNLSTVYPVSPNITRGIETEEAQRIKEAFATNNGLNLISALLTFSRFPIDDPYLGFLRKDASAMGRNPQTVKRISDHLFKIGIDGILNGVNKPKSSSREFGPSFRNYLNTLGFPVLQSEPFLRSHSPAFLDGGDAALKIFSAQHLGYKGKKGLDFVLKKNGEFFIGETKFITASGGGQNNGFREAIGFIKKKSRSAQHIAIIDGVVWAASVTHRKNLFNSVKRLSKQKLIMSALLLKQFISD